MLYGFSIGCSVPLVVLHMQAGAFGLALVIHSVFTFTKG